MKDQEQDILFKNDDIDYNKYIDRLDYRYFGKDDDITQDKLLPPISHYTKSDKDG